MTKIVYMAMSFHLAGLPSNVLSRVNALLDTDPASKMPWLQANPLALEEAKDPGGNGPGCWGGDVGADIFLVEGEGAAWRPHIPARKRLTQGAR